MTEKIGPFIPAVLFDLDGTLIDPFIGIAGAYRNLCDSLGVPKLTDDEVRQFIGPPIQEAVATQFQLSGDAIDQAVRTYREYYGTVGIREFTPFSGVTEMLTALSASGVQLDIATSKPTFYAQKIVEAAGWESLISHLGGAELDGSRRHKADVIAWVLERLDEGEKAVMFVGDRPEDVFGATANGLPCIGVDWGFGESEDLIAAGAVTIVYSVEELTDELLVFGAKQGV